jgi:hypothetical protein
MDTRAKILTAERALDLARDLHARHAPFALIRGYFDVLQPAMVRQLAEHRSRNAAEPVFAVVLNPPAPLLSASARAELAAGLRVVDYVIPWDGDADRLAASLAPRTCINLEAAHAESTERLIQHVCERHGREFQRRRQN